MKNIVYISIVLILFTILILFVYQKENVQQKVYTYLESKECDEQVNEIRSKHSFFNKWSIKVDLYNRYEYTFTYENQKLSLKSAKNLSTSKVDQELLERLKTAKLCTATENLKGEKSDTVISNMINMKIKENSLTKTSATIILNNKNNKTYTYGEGYSIEYNIDDIWYVATPISPLDIDYIAYHLKPNEKWEQELDWTHYYGELPSGKYRVIKSFNVDETRDDTSYKARAEFIIE